MALEELRSVTEGMDVYEQCDIYLDNWHIVLKENEEQLAYVTASEERQWVSYRDSVLRELAELENATMKEMHSYLKSLNERISGAQRVDMEQKFRETELSEESLRDGVERLRLGQKIKNLLRFNKGQRTRGT